MLWLKIKGQKQMSNKTTTTKKKMASLGLKKTEYGDYEYIDSKEKGTSKYKTISCKPASLKTVEGNYKISLCEKNDKLTKN